MSKEASALDGLGAVTMTFMFGFWLTGLHLPENIELFRPLWVPLILIYWIIALPYRMGVYTAAVVGLLLDLFLGVPLGQNAFSLAVVGYLAYLLHLRIRLFPVWQQCLIVLLLVGIYQLINRVTEGIMGQSSEGLAYYQPTLVSAFIWPWVYVILRAVRRRFRLY